MIINWNRFTKKLFLSYKGKMIMITSFSAILYKLIESNAMNKNVFVKIIRNSLLRGLENSWIEAKF